MTQTKGVTKKPSGRATKARSLACRECRDRKIRCDGARPICDSCSRRGLGADQCRYPEIEHEGSIASSRSYIRALQKRVQELEAREQQAQALSPQGQHACAGVGAHEDGWNKSKAIEQPLLPSIHADGSYGVQRYPSAAPLSAGHDSINYYPHPRGQMGASPPLTDDLEDHSPAKASFGSYSTNSKAALMLSKILLPPTEIMEDLVREYFDSDWITMPLIHRSSFFTKYERLIAVSNSRYRRDIPLEEATELAATYCLLMGMLALGERARCGRADAFESDAANGSEFYEQARGLLLTDLISTPSLLIVQAMLTHARFLRRDGSNQESWVLAGLAHRLAEGLLLHVDLPGKTQAEREERRRVWCACAFTMRMQGVAYGKPSNTAPEFGPFPQEVDDEYLESQTRNLDRTQPPEAPSAISFFVYSLRLSDSIVQPIQALFFDKQENEKKETDTEILSTTLKLDAELQEWWDSLPRHLQLAGQSHTVFGRQVALMRIRYLEAKALLYRATIMKLVRTHTGAPVTGLTKVLLSGVVDACFSTSVDLMESINYHKDILAVTGTPEGHTIISLCNIGMTLRVLLKHSLFSDPIKTNAYEKEIHNCLFFVRRFNAGRLALADKYIHVFEALARPQAHSPARNIDPILDTLMSRENQQTEKIASATKAEMAMLDAWYHVEPDLTGLDFSIREIVSFW